MSKKLHYVYICTTCDRNPDRTDSKDAKDGLNMLKAFKAALKKSPLQSQTKIKSIKCMGGCKKACSVGFNAQNKQACLFTHMAPDHPEDILAVLEAYINHPTGRVKYKDLPDHLDGRFLCRIPQIPKS